MTTHASTHARAFSLPAEVCIHEAAALKAALPDPGGLAAAVDLDASAVTDIDLAGVQLLLAWTRAVRAGGHDTRLVQPSRTVADALQLLGLAAEFGLGDPGVEAS